MPLFCRPHRYPHHKKGQFRVNYFVLAVVYDCACNLFSVNSWKVKSEGFILQLSNLKWWGNKKRQSHLLTLPLNIRNNFLIFENC